MNFFLVSRIQEGYELKEKGPLFPVEANTF